MLSGPPQCIPICVCSGWGLPSHAVADVLVRSYRTVSAFLARKPPSAANERESSFLWHFPSGRPAQPLAGILPYGARTFLAPYGTRPSGPLACGIVTNAMSWKLKTCALVASSDFNGVHFSTHRAEGTFDYVIAVDGGYAHLQAVGCEPDIVIGDFDSLGYVPQGDVVIEHPSHKDKSDLELALDYAAEQGFGSATIYGALGGRLDHSVANLQMCARFAEQGMELVLIGVDCAVGILVGPGTLELPLLDQGTVSVFSAVDESRGVAERGMEYPLDNATLTNRTTLGLSNELIGQPASVSVDKGTLLVFYPAA